MKTKKEKVTKNKKNNEVIVESNFQEFSSKIVKEEENADYALKMINIHKSFNNGAIKANVGMNLLVKRNTIHALIGENGAGKSTLMSILFGMYTPDIGEIWINNEKVSFKSAKDTSKYKIGMVHQHFKLVDNFTVFQNVILGTEKQKYGFLEKKESIKKLKELIDTYGFNIDVNSKISNLNVGQQQKVEILKILYRDSDIMIFDEPTAVLSDSEIKSFLEMLSKFKENGKTIIIITHKLHEIKTIADEATVIRKGKYIDFIKVKDTSVEKMAELMVGKKITQSINNMGCDKNKVILEVKDLIINFEPFIQYKLKVYEKRFKNFFNKLLMKFKDKTENSEIEFDDGSFKPMINFKIHAGEIYAIAGIEGNGQSELVEQLAGLSMCNPNSVFLNGQCISNLNVKKRIKLGISHIPEDRHKYGLDLDQTVRMNIVNNQISNKPFSNCGIIVDYEIVDHSQKIIDKYDIRGSSNGIAMARSLSGGNQQKIILGREIEKDHKLIILAQPTRGLDVGAIQNIHNQIIEEKKKGNAVLLISYELDEILALADTVAVISKNKIIEENSRETMTRDYIGQLLAGESI